MRSLVVAADRSSGCGFRALENTLNSGSTHSFLLWDMWDLLRPGIGPVSPSLAGEFLTTGPPGKSDNSY